MPKTILLLDDDPDEQSVLRDAFAALHVDIDLRQFYNTEKLFEYLNEPENIPEILLIDVNLPGQTGLEFLRELNAQEKFAGILTVIYTNSGDDATIAQSFEYGVGVFMRKVNNLEKLKENLATLLAWNAQVISTLPIRGRTFRN